MFLVGLTGGIASGKSTVSRMFKDLGCPIVDADLIAREVVEPGTSGWKKIRAQFGDDVLLEDGKLDREKLGKIIFADSGKRKLLNSITHPEIYKAMIWQIIGLFLRGHAFAILDLPLLFESGKMVSLITYTIVVSCTPQQQLRRLMDRNKYSKEEAQKRIDVQMSLDEKCKQATYIVDNSRSVENTREQVIDIYRQLKASRAHWKLRIAVLSLFLSICWVLNVVFVR